MAGRRSTVLRRNLLPPPGFRYVGRVALPGPKPDVGAVQAAERALRDAGAARSTSQEALTAAGRAVLDVRGAVGRGARELAVEGARLLDQLNEALVRANAAAKRAEDISAAIEAVVAERIAWASSYAVEAGEHARAAGLRVHELVGIQFVTWQEDCLVIVLTDGRIFRKCLRGPRGYGSAGPSGRDGRDGIAWRTAPTATDYAAVLFDFVLADASGGAVTVTVPSAATSRDKMVAIKRVSVLGGVVVVASSGGLIEGLSSLVLDSFGDLAMLLSDGIDWWLA